MLVDKERPGIGDIGKTIQTTPERLIGMAGHSHYDCDGFLKLGFPKMVGLFKTVNK